MKKTDENMTEHIQGVEMNLALIFYDARPVGLSLDANLKRALLASPWVALTSLRVDEGIMSFACLETPPLALLWWASSKIESRVV